MSLCIYVLADVIHLVKIIVLCDMFFSFRRRKKEHNMIVLLISGFIMSGISVFIYFCNNHFVETFAYIVAIVLLIYYLYKEKWLSVVIVVAWMILALSLIDTMISTLYDISMDLLKVNGENISNLCVSFISLLFVYIVGNVYKKNTVSGMISIGILMLECT